MSRYSKGVRNEKRTAEYLRAMDYYCIESRGSHGHFDVIGIYFGKYDMLPDFPLVKLVQCKSGSASIKQLEKDLKAFLPVIENKSISIEIHLWRKYKRVPDITYIK